MSESLLAVFADVHANLEALHAVVEDMDKQGMLNRVCLGDIVGYSANPAQCLKLIRDIGCSVVRGNHDDAAANDVALDGMRDLAQSGIKFARQKLSTEQRAYLAGLPLTFSSETCQFVHASLAAPDQWRYVMREPDAQEHFKSQTKPLCFCGHTHVPTLWHLSNSGNITCRRGKGRIHLPPGGKTLVNVGSVGQPRDLCADACYVTCDPQAGWVEFHRVPYDVAKARRKIARAGLPRYAAQRLSLGR